MVEDYVTFSDPQVTAFVQEVICRSPTTWLNLAEEHFLSSLDFLKPIQVSFQVT